MKPADRGRLLEVLESLDHLKRGLNRALKDIAPLLQKDDWVAEYPVLSAWRGDAEKLVLDTRQARDEILENLEAEQWRRDEAVWTTEEVARLKHLNTGLWMVQQHLLAVAAAIEPGMQTRIANPGDPLYDYEIEVTIDYILEENDPDYRDDSDNILAHRDASVRFIYRNCTQDLKYEFWQRNWQSDLDLPQLRGEEVGWLLHDLTSHSYGPDSPRLSPRECLKIGAVWVDVQVWHQYSFNVGKLAWGNGAGQVCHHSADEKGVRATEFYGIHEIPAQ